MSSDCREFAELLLDLAYGELDDGEASRLRVHATSCAACRTQLDEILLTRKLVGELPKPETIPQIADLVLAEADRVAASYANRPSESGVSGEHRIAQIASPGPGFFDRLRVAIFKPAFATALAATVVFAVSFYLYRNASPEGGEDIGTPGAPFYGPAGVMSAAPREPSPSSTVVAREDGMRAAEEPAGLGAEARSPSALGTGGGVAQSKGSLGTAGPAQVNSADELDRSAPGFGDVVAAAPEAEGAPSWSTGGTGFGGGGKAAGAAPAKDAPSDKGDADLFIEGMAAYDRGDCDAATVSLERVVDSYGTPPGLVAKALHHLARCARRSGSCGRAVVYYERLFSEHPGYEGLPDAMWEAAACHRRLGHVEQALALLRQLSELPGWEERANAETKSIERLAADQ
jgi:TolA-binding protein